MISINSSFDAGVLRVCYHGKNRNRSEITKEIFEKCIKTIYNCPIVCNYIREDDEIGSHDVEVIKTSKGLKLVNVTTPVGVVPAGANYWWEKVEEDNGTVHEYLCVDVLIWKRQEAYSKLKENEITDESMEITVKDGEMIDGYYRVYDFEFTAFCLLGTAEPCFESASVRLFDRDNFMSMYSVMMDDLKQEISKVQSANAVDILHPQNYSEGGNETLNKKLELLSKYNLTVDMLDFDIKDLELSELEAKFKEIKKNKPDDDDDQPTVADDNDDGDDDNGDDTSGDPDPDSDPDGDGTDGTTDDGTEGTTNDDPEDTDTFSLSGEQFRNELIDSLTTEKMTSSWGEEIPRYIYVDYDSELSEIYCYDYEDWKLYGFTYVTNGDSVSIDFSCKKRKKFSIVDFEDNDDGFEYSCTYKNISQIDKSRFESNLNKEKSSLEEKFSNASQTIENLNIEVAELRKYKNSKENDEREIAENKVFSLFEDLSGVEAFEALKESSKEFSIEDLEEKCFAIRGRKNSNMNFTSTGKGAPKLPIQQHHSGKSEPYDGLFLKYKHN